jgi:hypothetical protein
MHFGYPTPCIRGEWNVRRLRTNESPLQNTARCGEKTRSLLPKKPNLRRCAADYLVSFRLVLSDVGTTGRRSGTIAPLEGSAAAVARVSTSR